MSMGLPARSPILRVMQFNDYRAATMAGGYSVHLQMRSRIITDNRK